MSDDPLEGMKLTVLTPAAGGSLEWLPAAEESIAELDRILRQRGAHAEWALCLDGASPESDLDSNASVISWARQRGVSAARNAALASTTGDWVFPLDADDLLNPHGVAAAASVASLLQPRITWLGLNRTLINGEKTPHWFGECQEFQAGALAQAWTSPFPFHPNSIFARREEVWLAGGWPATAVNEDLGLALLVSEGGPGMMYPAIATRYRTWRGQEVGQPAYDDDKKSAFAIIEQMLSARRALLGRSSVCAPIAGPAFGREALGGSSQNWSLAGITIGVSLDGVVRDYTTGMRWWLESRGDSPNEQDHGTTQRAGRGRDAKESQLRACESGLNTWLPPVRDAVASLADLQCAGARVVAYAARTDSRGHDAFRDLEKWMVAFGVHLDDIVQVSDGNSLAIDLFIEQSPPEIEYLRGEGKRVMVLDRPWNQTVTGPRLLRWDRCLEDVPLALGAP